MMWMQPKVRFLLVSFLVLFGIVGCSQNDPLVDLTTESSQSMPKTIIIATFVSHPALDQLQDNIIKQLGLNGYKDGHNIILKLYNANGTMNTIPVIAKQISALNPEITIAITTPIAQSLLARTKGNFIFSAVSDPIGSGLIESFEVKKPNISGVTDAWPYEKQLALIKELTPEVTKIGVILNPAESSSAFGIKKIRALAPLYDLEILESAVNSSSEVFNAVQAIYNRVDAVYLSSDSTAIGGIAGALRVAVNNKFPLYVGDSGTVKKGGLAAYSIGYADIGIQTANIAIKMLNGETDIPIEHPEGSSIYINIKAAEMMGVTIPSQFLESSILIESIDD